MPVARRETRGVLCVPKRLSRGRRAGKKPRSDSEQDAHMLLRVVYVARQLDVSPSTIRGWIHSGHLEAMKLPRGEYRIPRSALDRITSSRSR